MSLRKLIADKFTAALSSGAVKFTDASLIRDCVNGVDVCYTLAPALGAKPKQSAESKSPSFDPFENPEEALVVVKDWCEDYSLVLNKFSVFPNHFLMITKAFKSQNSPLSPDDLSAAFKALTEANADATKRHVGFFNCGDMSGASQPHKHVQFVEIPEGFKIFAEQIADLNRDWKITNQAPLLDPRVPFLHFILPVIDVNDTEDIADRYSVLLSRVLSTLRNNDADSISYNFVFTDRFMMATPRRAENSGPVSINALGTIGLILAKSEENLKYIRETDPLEFWSPVTFGDTEIEKHHDY